MKKQYHMHLLSLALAAVLTGGCAAPDSTSLSSGSSAQATETSAVQAAETSDSQAAETSDSQTSVSALPQEAKELSSLILFEAQDIEGNTVSSSVFSEAKLTMVNVWATYCNPCLSEMPELGELAKEYDPKDFQIIGIISDVQEGSDPETLELAADLISKTGADYPHLLLNESLYYALLTDVTAVPTTFFITETGKVADTVIGAMDKSAWEETINGLLEEP